MHAAFAAPPSQTRVSGPSSMAAARPLGPAARGAAGSEHAEALAGLRGPRLPPRAASGIRLGSGGRRLRVHEILRPSPSRLRDISQRPCLAVLASPMDEGKQKKASEQPLAAVLRGACQGCRDCIRDSASLCMEELRSSRPASDRPRSVLPGEITKVGADNEQGCCCCGSRVRDEKEKNVYRSCFCVSEHVCAMALTASPSPTYAGSSARPPRWLRQQGAEAAAAGAAAGAGAEGAAGSRCTPRRQASPRAPSETRRLRRLTARTRWRSPCSSTCRG